MLRRPAVPLLVALVCALALALTGVLALASPAAHERDAAMLHGFVALDRPGVHGLMKLISHLADPVPYALAGLALTVVAVARGRAARAGAVAALLVLTGATTQILKHLLAQPRIEAWLVDQVGDAAWPSGHATAAMSLALCAVLVVGPGLRPLTALLGAGYAIAVGYALVAAGWHLPSDVLGGFLVAATFTLLGAAALAALEARRPHLAPAARGPALAPISVPALVAVSAAFVALAGMVVHVKAPGMTLSALEHPAAIAAGLGIGALGLMLTAGLAAALRH
ncbi:MAG: hypothetical protein QOD81_3137 [Solirubrobacteraceae bacterium]|nr:hypothetical protein [Solirubrobacteraceae bacterium]